MPLISTKLKLKIREALALALPIIIGQLGQVLMGPIDSIQLGALGHEYIAGTGFANNIYWMVNLLGMGILFAVSTLVSEVRGEKQEWKIIAVYRSGIKVALLLSVVFTVVMWFIIRNITLFGQDAKVNDLAVRFLDILNFSTVFVFLFTACKQLLDGMGRTKVGMTITVSGLLLNVLLNWLLIYGNLGFPEMGIEGSALATAISRALMAIALIVIIWQDKQVRALKKDYLSGAYAKLSYIRQILAIGIPAGLQFFWEVAAFGAAQIMTGWLGVVHESAHQIAIGLASVTFMVLTGIAAAANILTGYSYGARDREGIRLAGKAVFIATFGIELVFAVFFIAFHDMLPLMYKTGNAEVVAMASTMLILAAFFQVSDGLQAVAAGALRGMQDVRIPSIIAFVTYWLLMIPLCYVLAFKTSLGLKGIWIGFIIGLSATAVLQLIRFNYISKRVEFKEV